MGEGEGKTKLVRCFGHGQFQLGINGNSTQEMWFDGLSSSETLAPHYFQSESVNPSPTQVEPNKVKIVI